MTHRVRFSVRTKLANGQIEVPGDEWPLLLYEDQKYDPDEPWDGLLRCKYLVWVSYTPFFRDVTLLRVDRHINIYLPHRVLSKKK